MGARGDDRPIQPSPVAPAIEPVWPQDRPFPLTAEECGPLVMGYPVPWHGTMREFLMLPGRLEMIDGWVIQRR